MGAEQSGLTQETLLSQRDEDIPYTSCSISKPISSGDSKMSSRLSSAQLKSLEMMPHNDIVVVTDGAPSLPVVDVEEQRLNSIPSFTPLLCGSVAPSAVVVNQLTLLDMQQVLALCGRYQDHLHQCAEAVAFDQNALCVRIKEVDFTVQTLYTTLSAQQKQFARYAEQIQKIGEISALASRIQMTLDQTLPVIERLNSILPVEEQLQSWSVT